MSKLFTLPKEVILTNAGELIPGAKAYFYVANTATPQSVYTEYTLTTPHSDPVVADGNGRFPTIYLDPDLDYKVVIKDASDVEIYSQDYSSVPFTLSQSQVGIALYPQTALELASSTTPSDYSYPPGNVKRYGATGDGTTDDTTKIQAAIDSGEKKILFPDGDYLVSKSASFGGDFPNGDQPCLFVQDKSGVTLRGEAKARLLVNEHAQGIIEMQGCVDCEVIGIELVGPTDFPQIDGTTGLAEKGDASNGYNTSGFWGQNKNNSNDTSSNTGGGFGGAFPQYAGGTAGTWGTWNDGYIGNVSYGLLIQKGCKHITVDRCKASGFNYVGLGVGHPGDATYTENEDIKFITCDAISNYSAGIHSMVVDGLLVDDCTLNDNGHPDFDYTTDTYADPGYGYTARGVATYYTKNATISNNLVKGNNRKGIDSHASSGLDIVNNKIRDCAANGISVPSTSGTQLVQSTKITGNRIKNCSYAITNIGAIVGGGPIDGGYSYANSLCDLIISKNTIEDCGGNLIEIKNGRNIQITDNILRGFDDRASGSKYFMFLGRLSTDEPIYNMNCSGNVCDADGDTSMYRGISVRYAENSQVNHNMLYMDHASAQQALELVNCETVQAFGNIAYVDSGATTSVPLNLLSTDAFTVGNYSDPDVGSANYPIGNEGTTGEQEHRFRVPHIIQLDITFNGTTSPSYTVNAGEDYVASVGELATYGAQVTFQNLTSTMNLSSSITNLSADGLEAAAGDITFIYERALSNTAMEIGLKTNASGTNIIASNCTGGTISVTIFVY